jgi:CHASE1-domain containing sensor protein
MLEWVGHYGFPLALGLTGLALLGAIGLMMRDATREQRRLRDDE